MPGFHLRTEWAEVFSAALGHRPWFLWAEREGVIAGVLPLMHISGPLFGKFLVSQPYLNSGGVLADDTAVGEALVGRATALADSADVRYLELRHELRWAHPQLGATSTEKVHMRLALKGTPEAQWDALKSKLRSQIRKPLANAQLQVKFGSRDELGSFYDVFSRNMRDLGTPPFPKTLFDKILLLFGDQAEIATVYQDGRAVASGLLLHGPGVTLIPSASSLREHNHSGCNMLLYWRCIERSIAKGQQVFDFGRSSPGSGTYRFKEQWGAVESAAVWQYYLRRGEVSDMRPAGGRFDVAIAVWQQLPVWVTRLVGPAIVRGIP